MSIKRHNDQYGAEKFQEIATKLRKMRPGEVRKRQKEALAWFASRHKKKPKTRVDLAYIGHGRRAVSRIVPGQMLTYSYEPKHRETLEFYDRFPLIIVTDLRDSGFSGINLHYLHPLLRAKLLGVLMKTVSSKKMHHLVKMKVSYQIAKAMSEISYFKFAYKMYLKKHIKSRIVRIQPLEWRHAIFLPYERFVGASSRAVWAKSQRVAKPGRKKR